MSNGDVTRLRLADDFSATIEGAGDVEGQSATVLNLRAKRIRRDVPARAVLRSPERRLAKVIARLQRPGADEWAAEDHQRLQRLLDAVARKRTSPRRIAVRRGAAVTLVEPESILFCRAEDKDTVLYTADGEHVADRTIEELEAALPETFLRIHRSTIVNPAAVRDVTSVEGGRFVVTLNDTAAHKSLCQPRRRQTAAREARILTSRRC